MEKVPFTLRYNGKTVACVQEGNLYIAQISYNPMNLERKEDNTGNVEWVDKDLQRVTPLSEEIGWLIQEQHINFSEHDR